MPGPYNSLPFSGVKVLLVTMYFPPAGGGGVQRPLKLAQYLPALGIETHVLAPDDSSKRACLARRTDSPMLCPETNSSR